MDEKALNILAGIEPLLRGLLSLLEAARHSSPTPVAAEASPCASCPKYDTCTTVCEDLARLLPPADAGASPKTFTTAVPLDILHHDHGDRPPSQALFEQFRVCKAELDDKHWEVICMVFRDGLTQKEAATRLAKSPSTVSELLKKAREIKDASWERLLKKGHTAR